MTRLFFILVFNNHLLGPGFLNLNTLGRIIRCGKLPYALEKV